MRRWILVTAVLVGLCATSAGQEGILPVMLEKSEVVAHVKVLDIQGGMMAERGVVEWAALCEVTSPIKGGLKKMSKVRFRFNQFTAGGHEESIPVQKDRQYVLFLAGQSGGVRFPGDDGVKVAYRLVDRWVGVLPYHPHLIHRLTQLAKKRNDTAENIRLATSAATDPRTRFDAVRLLAIGRYTPDGAEALTDVACHRKLGRTTRGYAAMGLRNYSDQMPKEMKAAIKPRLRNTLEAEGDRTPREIILVLTRWGDARYIQEILGEGLAGHSMEIEVLQATPDPAASDRLWQLYQSCPRSWKPGHYNRRAAIGRALAQRRDKRGIDILIELLDAENAPAPQYRSNTYIRIAVMLGEDFGYKGDNYRPALEQAIPKMIDWWKNNRETFTFRERRKPLD